MEQMTTKNGTTYSTTQVAEIAGVTFRMIDYWVRNGHITIRAQARGSGSRRRWTQAELDALVLTVEHVANAQETLDAFARGDLWHDCLKAVS